MHPSYVSPALVALNARIAATSSTINAKSYWDVKFLGNMVLAPGEIIAQNPGVGTSGWGKETLPEIRQRILYLGLLCILQRSFTS